MDAWMPRRPGRRDGMGLAMIGVATQAVEAHGAMQKPRELARMLDILRDHGGIQTVLEIGGMSGGTAWAWATPPSVERVIVVDSLVLEGRMECSTGHVLIKGDSHKAVTLERVQLVAPRVDFLFIDGDHSYPGVRKDYAMYGPLVRPGGVIALHDVSVEQRPLVRAQHDVIPFWNQIRQFYRHEEIYDPDVDWGGIGVLYVENQDAQGIEEMLPAPSVEDQQGTIMRPEYCERCGNPLIAGEQNVCAVCA